ncbi:hypothetical protein JOM56_010482 [Amanita muscaria]
MANAYSVTVTGIAPSTTDEKLHDFFSFCGRITSIDRKDDSATITYEKPSAAKTALMLSGGALDGNNVHVEGNNLPHDEKEEGQYPKDTKEVPHIDQHDKPRAGIAAEYLASGYSLGDDIIRRLIDVDAQQGISKRFLSYMQHLDTTVGARALGPDQTLSAKLQATVQSATEQARAIDQQKGFSKIANNYYESALSSPLGQKVKLFYTTTSKQVKDIHDEARRITDQQKQSKTATSQEPSQTSGPSAVPDEKTQAAPTVL